MRDTRNGGGIISSFFRLILSISLVFGLVYIVQKTIGFDGLADKVTSAMGTGLDKASHGIDSAVPADKDKNGDDVSQRREYQSHNDESMTYLRSHIAPRLPMSGYDPRKFSAKGYGAMATTVGWKDATEGCTIRQITLSKAAITGGNDTRGGCADSTGPWRDGITGAEITDKNAVSVSAIVPLPESWVSGATKMSQEDRAALFNDPVNVVATAAAERKFRPIDQWHPVQNSCDYADRYVYIKSTHKLTATQSEIDAVNDIWKGCS